MRIRPNCILVQPIQPKGVRNGIYIDRHSSNHPRVWGVVVAIHPTTGAWLPGLSLSDLVLWERHKEVDMCDEALKLSHTEESKDPMASLVMINVKAVQVIISPSPVEVTL
jgi:hypothetical protein